jgi:zinc transporter ZupT
MDRSFLQLLAFGVLAGAANVLGGLILFPGKLHHNYRKLLRYLLALGAGFMLGVAFIELVPKSVSIWQAADGAINYYVPMLLILFGYLLTQFFEHTIAPHFHLGEEMHSEELISASSAYTAIGGLLIHTFFDGVSIAAASSIDLRIGMLVFIAVFLHKFPEGFTIGSLVIAAGKGFKEVMAATAVIGSATLIGVIVFYLIGSNFHSAIQYALPVAAGVTIYVAASDLVPEVNHHGGKSPLVSLSVFGGVALFFATHLLLSQFMPD